MKYDDFPRRRELVFWPQKSFRAQVMNRRALFLRSDSFLVFSSFRQFALMAILLGVLTGDHANLAHVRSLKP